jgi:carboxymethylenebutenolidase
MPAAPERDLCDQCTSGRRRVRLRSDGIRDRILVIDAQLSTGDDAMCYPFDAQPPEAPGAGGEIGTQELTLTSQDGTHFAAFYARPAGNSTTGIVVLPDVRGLFPFYEDLARGFAGQGVHAVAIDYFGRTAGVARRGADFEFMPHVRQTKAEQIVEDVGAAVDFLRSPEGGNCVDVFTVGFCFGGSNSWLQAAAGHGLSGAIGFYGRPGPSFADNSPGPLQRANELAAPILALMGGADQGIPVEQARAFERALAEAGVPHEVVIYEGAPHSFFDRAYKEFEADSKDAWRRVLAFIHKYSRTPAPV